MARDNSPNIRQQDKIKRRLATRDPNPRILIVTEGTETEPNYFMGLKNE